MTKHDSIPRFSIRQRDPDEVGMMRQSGSSLRSLRPYAVRRAQIPVLCLLSLCRRCHMVVFWYRALLRHDSRIEFSGRSLVSCRFYLNTVPDSLFFLVFPILPLLLELN